MRMRYGPGSLGPGGSLCTLLLYLCIGGELPSLCPSGLEKASQATCGF